VPYPDQIAGLEALKEWASHALRDLVHPDAGGGQPAELDEAVDHVRGAQGAHVLIEYGDYECPYSRAAYREIQRLEGELEFRFVFRHFPLTEIHPHALAAAAAAEAASLQGQFWEMHDWLYSHQKTLAEDDLRAAAVDLTLDVPRFDDDRVSPTVLERIRRDMESGLVSGEVRGTPTLFVDGIAHREGYDAATLRDVLAA
jgi:protein-disulfide isomerase